MGDAFLMNSGGGLRYLGLTIDAPPAKTAYQPGQAVDMAGAVVVAEMGRDRIVLSRDEYTVSPDRALLATDTSVRVTAVIDGISRYADFPITVGTLPALDDCSWEEIAYAAAAGTAQNYWSLGDTKHETIGGADHTLVLVGFGQDTLAPTDVKYGTAYNGGTNKAGMTFVDYTGVTDWYHNVSSWPRRECYAVRTALPAWMDACPDDMRNALRRVAKSTVYHGSPDYLEVTYDKAFLLSHREAFGPSRDNDFPESTPAENQACSWYQYFADEGPLPHDDTDTSPLRSMHKGCSASVWHNSAIGPDGDISELSGTDNAKHILFPVFCV